MKGEERLDNLLERLVAAGVPGCALAVSYRGRIVYTGYCGMADLEKEKPIDENTVYRIASCTKNLTATAAMRLYEEGQILLSDSVEQYLPFFKNMTYQTFDGSGELLRHPVSRPVTIRDLLTMTSGIPYLGRGCATAQDYLEQIGGMYAMPVMELAKKISQIPLAFDPGTHWHYGFGYDVLAAVIEAVTGKRYSDYLEETILKPLGMEHTAFVCSEEMEWDLAPVYRLTDQGPVNISRTQSAEQKEILRGGFGGGGLMATLGDLVQFAGMWAQGGAWKGTRILGRATIDLMRKNHLSSQALEDFRMMARQSYPWYQGYGWGLAGRTLIDPQAAGSNGSIGEFGWCGATGPYLLADPERQLGIAYAQQTSPVIGGMQDYCHPRVRNAVYSLLEEWD